MNHNVAMQDQVAILVMINFAMSCQDIWWYEECYEDLHCRPLRRSLVEALCLSLGSPTSSCRTWGCQVNTFEWLGVILIIVIVITEMMKMCHLPFKLPRGTSLALPLPAPWTNIVIIVKIRCQTLCQSNKGSKAVTKGLQLEVGSSTYKLPDF